MWRGARVAESGGLENRCTLTGTVGSNPTLSVRDFKSRISNLNSEIRRDRLIGMAPRWKRGGPKGLCGFESRSLRFLISNPKSEILISNLKFEVWDLNIR